MAETAEKVAATPEIKGIKHRSPNYPAIGLRKAIERATEFYVKYKRNVTPVGLAHAAWNFKEHSGAGNQLISALKSFGLLEIVGDGSGAKRQVKLSDLGYKIMEDHPAKDALLKSAAVAPAIYAEIWKKFEAEVPPNELLTHYLKFDRSFNPDSIGGFIADFRDTVTFAKLESSDIINAMEKPETSPEEDLPMNHVTPAAHPSADRSQPAAPPLSSPLKSGSPIVGQKDFPLYLTNNQRAVLYVPANMTTKDYELLKRQIENHLMVIEATSVADTKPQ